jgi:hypothetical protein
VLFIRRHRLQLQRGISIQIGLTSGQMLVALLQALLCNSSASATCTSYLQRSLHIHSCTNEQVQVVTFLFEASVQADTKPPFEYICRIARFEVHREAVETRILLRW